MNLQALQALGVTGLRGLSLGLSFSGNGFAAARFEKLANALEAGANIDADLQAAADKLDAGPLTDADWQEVEQGVRDESAELRDR